MTPELSARRLRVSHYVVQPVLVWDDGRELAPGPRVDAVALSTTDLLELPGRMPTELMALEAQLSAPDAP